MGKPTTWTKELRRGGRSDSQQFDPFAFLWSFLLPQRGFSSSPETHRDECRQDHGSDSVGERSLGEWSPGKDEDGDAEEARN